MTHRTSHSYGQQLRKVIHREGDFFGLKENQTAEAYFQQVRSALLMGEGGTGYASEILLEAAGDHLGPDSNLSLSDLVYCSNLSELRTILGIKRERG